MPFSAENDSYQIDTGWTPVMPNIYEVFKVNKVKHFNLLRKTKMKLAEALLIRSDMQKKLAQLKGRINANIKVQEGDTPSEDPNALMIDASQIIAELCNSFG